MPATAHRAATLLIALFSGQFSLVAATHSSGFDLSVLGPFSGLVAALVAVAGLILSLQARWRNDLERKLRDNDTRWQAKYDLMAAANQEMSGRILTLERDKATQIAELRQRSRDQTAEIQRLRGANEMLVSQNVELSRRLAATA